MCTFQARKLEQVFLRGSMIRYFVLPDILKEAPVFKKVAKMVEEAHEAAASAPKGGAKKKKLRLLSE